MTVEVHFAEPVEKFGVFHFTDAVVGSVSAPMAWPRRRMARSLNTANLFFDDTCQVRRTIGLFIFSSETPCSQVPGLAAQVA